MHENARERQKKMTYVRVCVCVHTRAHLLHRAVRAYNAHTRAHTAYCLLSYKILLDFHIFCCGCDSALRCFDVFRFFLSFICLFAILSSVVVVVGRRVFYRFLFCLILFSLLRCTNIYIIANERRFWRAHTFFRKRIRAHTRSLLLDTKFYVVYYFDPHSIFMIDCSMAFLFDFL